MSVVVASVEGNRQRLDGGAMFGNVPRALWERWIVPDAQHRIELACRGFLLREPGRLLLLETGIGAFFEPKLRERFGVAPAAHVLLQSLAARGVSPEAIDIVVLSHLHFDHAGGLLSAYDDSRPLELVFPRARFLVGKNQWERARAPHARDRASYIPELVTLLEESGRLELVDGPSSATLGASYRLHYSEGHTPGLMLTEYQGERGSLLFCGDLAPGRPWLHLPVTMGYDRFAERLIDEKHALFSRAAEQGTYLLLTHDADCAACRVTRDDKGRFVPVDEHARLDELVL